MIVEAVICTVIGMVAGWHLRKAYTRRLWRVLDSVQGRIRGK